MPGSECTLVLPDGQISSSVASVPPRAMQNASEAAHVLMLAVFGDVEGVYHCSRRVHSNWLTRASVDYKQWMTGMTKEW